MQNLRCQVLVNAVFAQARILKKCLQRIQFLIYQLLLFLTKLRILHKNQPRLLHQPIHNLPLRWHFLIIFLKPFFYEPDIVSVAVVLANFTGLNLKW